MQKDYGLLLSNVKNRLGLIKKRGRLGHTRWGEGTRPATFSSEVEACVPRATSHDSTFTILDSLFSADAEQLIIFCDQVEAIPRNSQTIPTRCVGEL